MSYACSGIWKQTFSRMWLLQCPSPPLLFQSFISHVLKNDIMCVYPKPPLCITSIHLEATNVYLWYIVMVLGFVVVLDICAFNQWLYIPFINVGCKLWSRSTTLWPCYKQTLVKKHIVKRTAIVFPLRFFWPSWYAIVKRLQSCFLVRHLKF